MLKNYQLTPIALGVMTLFSTLSLAHAWEPREYAPVPLNYQGQPSAVPKPNILVFIDNSYDGSRDAKPFKVDPDGRVHEGAVNLVGLDQRVKKIDLAKKAVGRVIKEFPDYHWGIAAYSPSTISMKKYVKNPLCFEDGNEYNAYTTGCTAVSRFGADVTFLPYYSQAGAEIMLPIRERNKTETNQLIEGIKYMPYWGQGFQIGQEGSGAHDSPLTSAFYELTRYYRGMRTAYGKDIYPGAGFPVTKTSFIHNNPEISQEAPKVRVPNPKYEGGQYISPIQYRCQSNNIILITSAAHFGLTGSPTKNKRAFYQPYHTDPLYRYDNHNYAMRLDSNDPQYGSEYKQAPEYLTTGLYQLNVSDLIGLSMFGLWTDQHALSYAVWRRYNDMYHIPGLFGKAWKLPSGVSYIRPVDDMRFTHEGRDDALRNQDASKKSWHPLPPYRGGDKIKRIINPYMEIIETFTGEQLFNAGVKNHFGNKIPRSTKTKYTVLSHNAYHEKVGLESFAHLAFEGDIIPKGGEYKYPVIAEWADKRPLIDGDKLIPIHIEIRNDDDASAVYADCRNKKCILHEKKTNQGWPRVNGVADLDWEGKPWDGSEDKQYWNAAEGKSMGRYAKQRIRTYTIGFGLVEENPKLDDFPPITIQKYGTGKNLNGEKTHVTIFSRDFRLSEVRDTVMADAVLYVREDMLKINNTSQKGGTVLTDKNGVKWVAIYKKGEKDPESPAGEIAIGEPIKTTTVVMNEGADRYVWVNYNGKMLKEDYGLVKCDKDEGTEAERAHCVKLRLVPFEVHRRLLSEASSDDALYSQIDPSNIKGSVLLERAAIKGGGFSTSMNIADEEALVQSLKNILANIDAAVVDVNFGGASGIAQGQQSLQYAVSTLVDPRRWISQVRHYNIGGENQNPEIGEIIDLRKPNFSQSKIDPKRTIIVNTAEKGLQLFDTNAPFDNAMFNITPDINAHLGRADLRVARSGDKDEWKKLVQWTAKTTKTDADNIFKQEIMGEKKLVYRERDYHEVKGKKELEIDRKDRYAEIGDVLDGNLLFFANEKDIYYTGYSMLAVASNDGMLHIFKTKADEKTREPDRDKYLNVLSYLPGATPRTKKGDNVLRNLVYVAEANYGFPENRHVYLVNGKSFYRKTDPGPQAVELDPEGSLKYGLMMINTTLAQGGRGAFALRVGGQEYNNPHVDVGLMRNGCTGECLRKNVPLYDTATIPDEKDKEKVNQFIHPNELGYVVGSMPVGRLYIKEGDYRYVSFLASGFDNPDADMALFVLDQLGFNVENKSNKSSEEHPDAGKLIRKISTGFPVDQTRNGLSAPIFVDIERDDIVDFVYAGDQRGNLWRFDLRSEDPKDWHAHMLFRNTRKGQSVTSEPAVFHDDKNKRMIVTFGTGSVLYPEDIQDHSVQSIYTVFDYYDKPECNIEYPKGSDGKPDKTLKGQFQWTDEKCQIKERDLLERNIVTEVQGPVVSDDLPGKVDKKNYRMMDKLDSQVMNELGKDKKYKGWRVDLVSADIEKIAANKQEEGERIVVEPIVHADVRNQRANFLYVTRIFKAEADETKIRCEPEPIDVEGWVMTLNVFDGGNPILGNPNNYRPAHQEGEKRNPQIAGMMLHGTLSAPAFINPGNYDINNQGQGKSGISRPPVGKGNHQTRENLCIQGKRCGVIVSDKGEVFPFCMPCTSKIQIRRLSWRELF